MNFRNLTIAAAIASALLIPAAASAATKEGASASRGGAHVSASHSTRVSSGNRAHVTRTTNVTRSTHVTRARVTGNNRVATRSRVVRSTNGSAHNAVNVNVRVGSRYNGGVWYGHRRHFWQGRWYNYGIGPCWLATPIGFVWTCG